METTPTTALAVTYSAAAKLLSVCPRTIFNLVREKKLRAIHSRFWTITSNVYAGFRTIGDGQGAVDWLCETYLKPKASPQATTPPRAMTSVEERAARYIATIPPAISGQGGHSATFYAA